MVFSLTQTDTQVNTAPSTNVVSFSINTGTADANRDIVIGTAVGGGTSASQPTGVTIDGAAAQSILSFSDADGSSLSFWILNVPSGTTSSAAISFGTTRPNTAIVVWSVIEGSSLPSDTQSVTASTGGGTLSVTGTIPSTGGGLGLCASQPILGGPSTHTWTNLTEVSDATLEGTLAYTTANSTVSGTATRTVTASGGTGPFGAAHSFGFLAFTFEAPTSTSQTGLVTTMFSKIMVKNIYVGY